MTIGIIIAIVVGFLAAFAVGYLAGWADANDRSRALSELPQWATRPTTEGADDVG